MGSAKGQVPLQAGDLGSLFAMFQAALAAKGSCIDSLQAIVARQREELALAWASIEKERQARGVAEEGVKALQCALDKCREDLRKEMLTRRGDHHKLLQQLSCEWEVLAVLEEEQGRREAAEMALALTQRWMERTLLRCQQLQHQHRLQRQQLKAAHADRDARWQTWAWHAAAEHEQVRQLCEHADIDLPDFMSILQQHADAGPPTDAWGAEAGETSRAGQDKEPVDSSGCVPSAEGKAASLPGSPRGFSKLSGGFGSECGEKGRDIPDGGETPPLSKSSSWSDLSAGDLPGGKQRTPPADSRAHEKSRASGAQPRPAGCKRQEDKSGNLRKSFEFAPPLQTQDGGEPQLAACLGKVQRVPFRRELSDPSALLGKAVRSPNKTPRPSANKVQSNGFGGIVKRIVRGSLSPLEAKAPKTSSGLDHAARGLDVPGSRSAPTSPLRRSCAAIRMGPPQGLKDLACNAFPVRDGTRRSRGEKLPGNCVHRQCGEQGHESTSRRSLVMR